MKLTVLGATGGVGRQVVRQALDAGHQVTAVVRDPDRFLLSHPALEVVTADVTDSLALRPAVAGRDAVLSGLGPRGRKAAGISSRGTRSALQALAETGGRRIVVVSAAPVGPMPEGESLLYRAVASPLLRRLLREVYADLAAMEAELARSDADWTVVRPPRLTDRPGTGRYRTALGANVRHGRSIARADVAHLMLAALDDPATVRQAVGVAY
ncbi:NAD(P)-dependent oxidoreductase [Peterkaempfera griseoplana]|uniref:NAD(P)-dependent oxidoreductase n=1 Tax=Peterkaempfera griseoplana TaxID=66896 RepID=UPI0006E19901|nr:SDR family oxidoreductase [Peterkaempfera griseoplana]